MLTVQFMFCTQRTHFQFSEDLVLREANKSTLLKRFQKNNIRLTFKVSGRTSENSYQRFLSGQNLDGGSLVQVWTEEPDPDSVSDLHVFSHDVNMVDESSMCVFMLMHPSTDSHVCSSFPGSSISLIVYTQLEHLTVSTVTAEKPGFYFGNSSYRTHTS